MQLILVDDDPISRRLLAAQIRALGYSVTEYEDGQDAWDALQHGLISLVISDWQMPGLDGPGLIGRIRAAEFPVYIYCILLSEPGQPAERGSVLETGADDFLSRPIAPEELRVRLHIASRILRLEQELYAAQAVLRLSQK
jgi:phosphoserine phosphatase RsbU/P